MKGGATHVSECISDFRDWATSLRYSTYDYSKAPESIIRGILKEALGEPRNTKTGQIYRGVVLRSHPPVVAMKKIRIRNFEDSADYTPYPEPTPPVEPCTCESMLIASWLRRRAHYHCRSVDCAHALSSEAKLIDHEGSHAKHRGPVCRCSIDAVRLPLRGVAHYHCNVCAFTSHKSAAVMEHKKSKHSDGSKPITLFGHPQYGDPISWGSRRLVKRDSLPPFLSKAQRDTAARVLGIREIPPCRDQLLNSAEFECFFDVVHIEGSGANENPRLIIAMDTSPILWVAHGLTNAEIRSYAEQKSVCYLPRCGFFTLNFALCIWRYYVETLSFQEVKRNLARCWSSNISRGLRRMPCADAREYLWIMGHLPSSEVIQKILSSTKFLYDEKIRSAKEALACIDGHVLRVDGHFKAPRRVGAGEGDGVGFACALAILGCEGYLLDELRFYKSESGSSYADSIRPILQVRLRNGLPPPHIITDNPSVLEGVLDALVESVWGYPGPKYILAGDPTHRKIEFQEAIDSTHQDSGCAIHDFSYIIRRSPRMVEGDTYEDIRKSLRRLEKECDRLYRRRRASHTDPYSANRPYNKGLWSNPHSQALCASVLSNPKRADNACAQKAFGDRTRGYSDYSPEKEILGARCLSFSESLYCHTGSLRLR